MIDQHYNSLSYKPKPVNMIDESVGQSSDEEEYLERDFDRTNCDEEEILHKKD
jgi:hypothetical protein